MKIGALILDCNDNTLDKGELERDIVAGGASVLPCASVFVIT